MMQKAFTGNSRKTRQVNLSGRASTNPWANLSGSPSPSPNLGGTQNTLAHAQAERVRRQQERERLTAARNLQRLWRGYASRQQIRSHWRREWDRLEQQRLSTHHIDYPAIVKGGAKIPGYESVEICLSQLRRLVHFLNVKDSIDQMRLLYFGESLQTTFEHSASPASVAELTTESLEGKFDLSKLGLLTAASIQSPGLLANAGASPYADEIWAKYFNLLLLLASKAPDTICKHATTYFQALAEHLSVSNPGPKSQLLATNLLVEWLRSTNSHALNSYRAFVSAMLKTSTLSAQPTIINRLAPLVDQGLLARAFLDEIQSEPDGRELSADIDNQLWRLSYFIDLYKRRDQHTDLKNFKHEGERIQVISLLLGQCANEVAQRLPLKDQIMSDDEEPTNRQPLPIFVCQQIESLADKESIQEVMFSLGQIEDQTYSVNQGSRVEAVIASHLANYAVALLRAFPDKAVPIRRLLYHGSVKSTSNLDVPTIRYFWNAAQNSNVFKGISQSQRKVLSLLKEPVSEHNQIGRPQPTRQEKDLWRDEWQIILLFLELYAFVLKPMDDEEFFSLQKANNLVSSTYSLESRRGALPLADISKMSIFLMNLAFTLYWNAGELAETNTLEDAGGLSTYFGTQILPVKRTVEKSKVQSLAGMEGVSQAYLKRLVTGLLRMLHERDSRRKFLPDKHWLMTSHVDMSGFIPAVVLEEEKRHELGDDLQEEEDELDEILNTSPSHVDSSDYDIRSNPFLRQNHLFGEGGIGDTRTRHSRYFEAVQRKRDLVRKKRQLESLAPRLEILRNLPFFIPFETRVQIFREFVRQDQIRRREGHIDPDNWRMHTAMGPRGMGVFDERHVGRDAIAQHRAEVHRESVFEDAFQTFYPLGEGLKEPIQISFIDKFGNPEAGIDGGGVTKEFLTSVTNETFDPKGRLNMFAENDQHEIYPNPTIFESTVELLKRMGIHQGTDNFGQKIRHFLRQFEFLGRILGKCMYEGILVDVNFAGFFLLKWALTGGTTAASNETAYRASINDVKDFDEVLYQGLLELKNYTGDVESVFSLNFSVTDTMQLDLGGREITHTVTKDLIKNGSNIAVTNSNRSFYIDQIARYRLQLQPSGVTNAFLKGLGQIIQPMWLAMFNQNELQTLVGGENAELDIADLRRHTQYNGLYQIGDDGLEHPTIVRFWKVLQEMSDEDRRKVLKFVTSTPRAPLLGFSHLQPPFTIHSTSANEGIERLPSTSTCVNLLKLPNYSDEKMMREKLLYAANSGAGFDLS